MNAEDGGYIGKIKFTKKADRYSENYITIDPIEQFILDILNSYLQKKVKLLEIKTLEILKFNIISSL